MKKSGPSVETGHALWSSFEAARSRGGVRGASGGVHDDSVGVNSGSGGVHDDSVGVHDDSVGVHDDSVGVHDDSVGRGAGGVHDDSVGDLGPADAQHLALRHASDKLLENPSYLQPGRVAEALTGTPNLAQSLAALDSVALTDQQKTVIGSTAKRSTAFARVLDKIVSGTASMASASRRRCWGWWLKIPSG